MFEGRRGDFTTHDKSKALVNVTTVNDTNGCDYIIILRLVREKIISNYSVRACMRSKGRVIRVSVGLCVCV